MTSNYLKHRRTLEEVYALIDKDRIAAAQAAQIKFRGDIESAVAAVSEISAVAGARIVADSQVVSAKILIDAEVGATRLLSEAEIRATQCINETLNKPREVVEAMLLEISRTTSADLNAAASNSVDAIKRDAEAAIQGLKEAGAIAIREIQALAAKVESQINSDAKTADRKLKEFRARPHTQEDADAEAEEARRLVMQAAKEETSTLQDALGLSLDRINKIADEACLVVQQAALVAEQRLLRGQELALARLNEVLAMGRSS